MGEPDLQSLAKLPPQADPAVERTIGAVLNAAYGTHGRDRERFASEAPGRDVCACVEAPGVLWHGLSRCSRDARYSAAVDPGVAGLERHAVTPPALRWVSLQRV